MQNININRQILITSLVLIVTILIFEISNLDILSQNYFFNFNSNIWIVRRDNIFLKFVFYDGIKRLLIIFLSAIFLTLVFFRKKQLIKTYQTGLIIVLLSGIFVPSTVASIKAITNVACPKNLDQYGGTYPYVKVLEKYPNNFKQEKRLKCWPAAHASGGFALLSLFFLFRSKRNQILSLIFSSFLGGIMGFYKMLIGDHFLSHTIISSIMSWLIILLIVKFLIPKLNLK